MITKRRLRDKRQTGREMYRMIDSYHNDLERFLVKRSGRLVPVTSLSLFEFFDLVRKIPYRRDIHNIEVVARPEKILRSSDAGMDCKKKSVLMSSYCRSVNIPFRLIASSRRSDGRIHHVFPQAKISGRWRNIDATYSHYRPFEHKSVTRAEVL